MNQWSLRLTCGHLTVMDDEGYEPPAGWCGYCLEYVPVSSGFLVGDETWDDAS